MTATLIHDIGVVGFVVLLPEPPSDNDTHMPVVRWRNGKPYARMIRSPEYDAWRQLAGHKLNRQETEVCPGRVEVNIILTDAGGGSDTFNVAKATADLLVSHGLIDDDARKFVRDGRIQVWPDTESVLSIIPAGEMQVRVRALPDAAS